MLSKIFPAMPFLAGEGGIATASAWPVVPQALAPDDILRVQNETTRADGGQVLVSGFGLEKNLSEFFQLQTMHERYDDVAKMLLKLHIKRKNVLVVPGYASNAFLFALLGARRVYGIDVDPASVSWQMALQQYFGYNAIGDILMTHAACPSIDAFIDLYEALGIKGSAREHLIQRVRVALTQSAPTRPKAGVEFLRGSLGSYPDTAVQRISSIFQRNSFDFVYVPYLLAIKNGVELEATIREAYMDIWEVSKSGAIVMISPFTGTVADAAANFESSSVGVGNLESLLPADKFDVVDRLVLGGDFAAALLRVKK